MPSPLKNKILLPAIILSLLVFVSCSVKKNTIVSRAYHNVTAHYNGFFNARERVKEGKKTLAAAHEDRYDRLLSVFKYGDEGKAKTIFPDMDEAIKKTSIVIQRHSMFINGKERCKWIPANYLVLGKAQFLKHDYWSSIETFQYVGSTYKDKKHRSVRYEAFIYLIQSYMELGKMADAEYLIDFLKNEKDFTKKLNPLFYATVSNFYIQKKEYKQSSEWLAKAVATTKKRDDKIRYSYILAQLYQKLDSSEKAFNLYARIIKMNPEYEMLFNARINRARSFDVNSSNAAEVKEELMKMLKDEKNIDYKDQIYYALAGVAQKENDTPLAVDYLKQSVATSTTNVNQKGLSYLELGEISFKKPDYYAAQIFYDSAAAFIATDYPDYTLIQNKKNNLGRLIKNLTIIAEQDSLLALGNMSASQQQAKIDAVIKAEEDEAARLKKLEDEQKLLEEQQKNELEGAGQQPFSSLGSQNNQTQSNSGGGAWYFYNQSAMSFGFTEFVKKWGNRKAEDNWRRVNKQSELLTTENGDGSETETNDSLELAQNALNDSIKALDSEKRKTAYLEKIPDTQAEKDECNTKILEAYYNAGIIYKEQLENPKEAAATFEALLKRYPENKYKLAAWYNLYRCYLAAEEKEKADYYKNLILTQFPDSEYARIITNPNYYKDAQRKTAIAQVFYENTYKAYVNGQYQDVIERKSAADSLFPPSNLTPKFNFLKALSIGKTQPLPNFEAALKNIIAVYPKDSVSILAKAILDKMSGQQVPASGSESAEPIGKTEQPQGMFTFNPDTAQMVMLLFPTTTTDQNELKNRLSDFNRTFYGTSSLNTTALVFDKDNSYLLIKDFKNANDAKQYITNINGDEDAFSGMQTSGFNLFALTQPNFVKLIQTKDLRKYLEFYGENYN
jgi:tetratricopeptide (TPR) repeat protein